MVNQDLDDLKIDHIHISNNIDIKEMKTENIVALVQQENLLFMWIYLINPIGTYNDYAIATL